MNIAQLHQLFLEHKSVCTDTRTIKKNDLFFALKGENFNGNDYAEKAIELGASYSIVDETLDSDNNKIIQVTDVLETLQKLANYHRNYLDIIIIGLTGSNGKTTTKELIHAVLSKKYKTIATKGNLNNHIGVPLTLLSLKEDTEFGIIEMGANHLNEIQFLSEISEPDYGYITNFGKAHLEGFGSLEGVIKGKSELYNYLKNHQKLIFVNGDDEKQLEITKTYLNIFTFNQTNNNSYETKFLESNPFVKCTLNDQIIQSKLIGQYNFDNISAAIAIAQYFDITDIDIKDAIESYMPENNRSQILIKGSNKIILDAYNANPSSMKVSLEHFSQMDESNKIIILGDMFELGSESKKEHQKIVDFISQQDFQAIYLVGANFYKTKTKTELINKFESFEDFQHVLSTTNISYCTLLLKGSRGMALERALDYL